MQEQKFIFSLQKQGNILQKLLSQRLVAGLLLAFGVLLVLVLLEGGSLLLFNPAHTFTLPFSPLIGLLLLVLEFALLLVGALLTIKPLAIMLYLHVMHYNSEKYNHAYIPLSIVTNRSATDSRQEQPASVATIQDEYVSLSNLVEQQSSHQLILGMPGGGKTMALRMYQYRSSQRPFSSLSASCKIPVYISLKNYALFLKSQGFLGLDEGVANENVTSPSFSRYLEQCNLPDIRYLRSYVGHLFRQGRVLLLCDGLDEVDRNSLALVGAELASVIRNTQNRLVVTSQEPHYRHLPELVRLVEGGQVACALLHPLQTPQIAECIEAYIERQDKEWKHTAGQVMSVIERTRLRHLCTNPMLLFILLGMIDKIGVERGKQIDTRSLLLREYVKRLLADGRKQAQWSENAPAEQDVIAYLSEIAYAAHQSNTLHAIQISTTSQASGPALALAARSSFAELSEGLRVWLEARSPQTVVANGTPKSVSYENALQIMQFALDADLIDIDSNNVLSFRHALIATYFVAEHLVSTDLQGSSAHKELLQHGAHWSQPIAFWAGLQDEVEDLTQVFFSGPDPEEAPFILERLALSLTCIGVLWAPPQADIQHRIDLPSAVARPFAATLLQEETRRELAHIFTLCAEAGAQEIYYSLLSLLMVEGADEFLMLLDQKAVLDLLFTQLQDAIDNAAYEAQVKRIVRVSGRFGGAVVNRAAQLSLPMAGRSPRLRAAVINTLGGTNNASAIPPLIERLRDPETFIVERAINALIRLGPALSLTRVLQEVEKRTPQSSDSHVHQAALLILERFMNEQDVHRRLALAEYQSTIEHIVSMLTANYRYEPEVQHRAQEVLVHQGQRLSEIATSSAFDGRWDLLIKALLDRLSSQDEVVVLNVIPVLQEIGAPTVPHLLKLLQSAADDVRVHVIEMLATIRDVQALSALLPLLADKSHSVQQRTIQALQVFAPESIAGLIEAVLRDPSDAVADSAARILVDIGRDVVAPVIEALPGIVPDRTRFLVQILELVHDPRSIDALISLLQTPQLEPLLVISLIRALGQFSDRRVVEPLLAILATTNPQFYEEAITALSQLGTIALPGLLATLDTGYESAIVQRVRRAILGISPFPGEQLMQALEQSTENQVNQIFSILRMQGRDAAFVLAEHLLHPDEHLRNGVQQTLEGMPGIVVVPALLAMLNRTALRDIASAFLLKYPDAAIVPLVSALSDLERSSSARSLLPQFGTRILNPLIVGLDDPRNTTREAAQRVLIDLVRQNRGQEAQQTLREVVRLFGDPLPPRAREALMSLLTREFASISLPVLLEGLEDVHLIEAVAEALTRLVALSTLQEPVLSALIESLSIEDRRSGSELALIRIGAPAVARVGELITDSNPGVAKSAMHILSEIGVPALSFIWTAYSDRNNLPRREAARAVFHSMPPEVIKDELVSLLVSENRDDIAMAVALLLERIDDENRMEYQDQVMVPELIDYVETHTMQETNLRICALLLLLGEQATTDHLIQALDDNPHHRKELTYMLLFLGTKTQELLQEICIDPQTNPELRNEIAGVLSMQSASNTMTNQVYRLSEYGLASVSAGALFSEQLAFALRILGGLLVSGEWHPRKLMELRDARESDDPGYELLNVLLGWRYTPEIEKMRKDIEAQQDMFKKELLALTMKLAEEQQHVSSLETDLEKVRQDHGVRGDELQKAVRERDAMRADLEQLKGEKNKQQVVLEETTRRYHALLTQYQGLQRQLQGLSQPQSLSQPQGSSPSNRRNTIR